MNFNEFFSLIVRFCGVAHIIIIMLMTYLTSPISDILIFLFSDRRKKHQIRSWQWRRSHLLVSYFIWHF